MIVNKKANIKYEFGLILIIFLIATATAFQGTSSSYSTDTKLDYGLTDNATSSSFLSRIISGFQAVANYTSSSFDGRFGILETNLTLTVSITITSPINTTYNYSTIDFNATLSRAAEVCLFSLDNFATNYSMTLNSSSTGANYTLELNDGSYTSTFWCNDSNSGIDTESVSFNVNSLPQIVDFAINSSDGTNQSNKNLNCLATINDSNSDAVNITVDWYKDSALTLSTNYENYDYISNPYFVDTLDYKNTTRGENWSCFLNVTDGVWTVENSSVNLTILNSPPVITLTNPANDSSVTNMTPTFNWTGFDEDGDSITYDFNISLVPASLCTDSDQFAENLSDNNYTVSNLNCYYDNGDYYSWSVRGYDNSSIGNWAYFIVKLSAIIDISLPVDSISFGTIPFLGSDNTTDDSPAPFVVQSNGNSFINLNISATNLWDAVGNPNSYYQIKVDNVTGEEGAFNWTGSTTNWVNVPALGNTIFISRLNYSDTTDSAEVDIYVQVPSNETPTTKSSTVTFVASYVE